MPLRPRPLLLVVVLGLTVTGCGFGLNTGNPRERADWAAGAERDRAVEQRRIQHEASLNQIRNGTLPPTTTTLPDPNSIEDPNATTTTQATTTTVDPVVGPRWCYGLTRFATVGQALFTSSSPDLFHQSFAAMESGVEEVATQGTAEVRPAAQELLAAVRAAEQEWAPIQDRGRLRDEFVAFMTEKNDVIVAFLRAAADSCLMDSLDGQLDPNHLS